MQSLSNRFAARVAVIRRRATGGAVRRAGASGASFGELSARLSRASKLVNQSRGSATRRS